MDRRTFVKGATLGVASTALPFTANLARSAPAGPVVHHHRAIAFRPFDELAEHYAPALRNLTPEQAVRRLYRGLLGISMPLPKGVDICVQYWERQGAEGAALTLRWFLQHPAFRYAKPRDGRGYVASGVSKEIAAALTRWRQTDILYRTLWNRPPTVEESTGTLMTLAELQPMHSSTKTIHLPRQSWITWSTAHAEMDSYQETYLETPWGPVPESAANFLRGRLAARGLSPNVANALVLSVAYAAASHSFDLGYTVSQVAQGLADETIDVTITTLTQSQLDAVGVGIGVGAVGVGVGVISLAPSVAALSGALGVTVALSGLGLIALGIMMAAVILTAPARSESTAATSSGSVGTPANGPSQTPQGTVTVGDFVSVTIGEDADSSPTGVGDVGNSGAGGTDGSDGAPE